MLNYSQKQPSVIYKNPHIYQFFMRRLYGHFFEDRYRIVCDEIPDRSSVVDVCAGDAYIFRKYLKMKKVKYLAIDNSPEFIRWGIKNNICYQHIDISEGNIPPGDVILMMASLYQFIPYESKIINKLIKATKDKVIITEPVSNISSSPFEPVARLAKWISTPYRSNVEYSGKRFSRETLDLLFKRFPEYEFSTLIPGNRELMVVFRKKDNLKSK